MRFSARFAPRPRPAPSAAREPRVTSPAAGRHRRRTSDDGRRRITVQGQADDSAGGQTREDLSHSWERVQRELRASVTESTYGLWFAQLRPLSSRGAVLYLTGPQHVRRWVTRRYPELLRAALIKSGSPWRDAILVAPEEGPEPATGGASPASSRPQTPAPALNSAYTFERFVIGDANRIAHAAALAVAESPGQAYNPLFLYGPPGLGKTHLLGAIANYLHQHSPELVVHYTTAEAFTNEFVAAVQGSGIEAFKHRYRAADVLLIDDVQFLEGKARTADEFFHTFNALYEAGAQLVFTADRLPSELSALAERLRQRFEWGLTVSIDEPDLSTRLIFLANLMRERSEDVAPEVMRAIASRASANLRLLEGALTRVLALASLTASSVTPEVVDQALPGERLEAPPARPGIPQVRDAVASQMGVPTDQLLSSTRRAPVVRARQAAMYLCRELNPDLSLPEIARAFNRSDHTTVIHAVRRIEEARTSDPHLNQALEAVSSQLAGGKDRDRTD